MGIPNDAPQLLILVTFVLPGLVYQAMRSRLRGPTPDEIDATSRVLRAVAWSTFLALLYVVAFGDALLDSADGTGWFTEHIRWSAALAIVLVFIVPAAIALTEQRIHRDYLFPRLRLHGLSTYDPTPTAWDHKFRDVEAEWTFVRVLTTDGKWIGGRFTGASYASSFPQPRELFIGEQFYMGDDGTFGGPVAGTDGVYIRCDDVRLVEFLRPEA